MNNDKYLIQCIEKFNIFQWLVFIRDLESKKFHNEDLFKNYLPIFLDLVIRKAPYCNNIFSFTGKISILINEIYKNCIVALINSEYRTRQFQSEYKLNSNLAISKFITEQTKNNKNKVNEIGRLLKLYQNKEKLVQNYLGFSLNQIIYFFVLHSKYLENKDPFSLKNMYDGLKTYDNNIKDKNIKKFLSVLSISPKEYRKKCKKMRIYKNNLEFSNLLYKFPIIELSEDKYYLPSYNILFSSLNYLLLEKLEDVQDSLTKKDDFKTKFGEDFENYIRDMTKFSHKGIFFECNSLITGDKKKKAEFYLKKDKSSIVIEAKLLHINENELYIKNNFRKTLIKTIKKALSQLESCFKKIKEQDKYGFVIFYTNIPLFDVLKIYKNDFKKYDFLDRVKVLSIVEYEKIIHRPYDLLIGYFRGEVKEENLFSEPSNPFLDDAISNFLNLHKKIYSSSNTLS